MSCGECNKQFSCTWEWAGCPDIDNKSHQLLEQNLSRHHCSIPGCRKLTAEINNLLGVQSYNLHLKIKAKGGPAHPFGLEHVGECKDIYQHLKCELVCVDERHRCTDCGNAFRYHKVR
jgi:hypothetical protein